MDKQTITTILAIWGAALSSFVVVWNFYRYFIQRGRLRVSCYIGKIVGGSEGIDSNHYLFYNITNIGKEPVMLTHIGGQNTKYHFIVTTHEPLPRMLQPDEYVLEYCHDLSALGEKLKNLTAIDSLGRTWKAPKKQVKKLKKDYASGKYSNSKKNSLNQ